HDSAVLGANVTALQTRIRNKFRKAPNYGIINRTKQKEDESFDDFQMRMREIFKVHSGLTEGQADDIYNQ
ncbi:hypothetical protein WMY93_034294, partial [Mugilogobius chulae]